MPTLHDVKFSALRNALYHTARRRRLDAMDRVGSFLVILFGAGAATDLAVALHPMAPKALAAIAAAIGALQLVFAFGNRARDHEFLQRRYYELLSEMDEFGEDKSRIPGWCGALTKIAGDEPPSRMLPEAAAYNAAASALGVPKRDHLVIPLWLLALGHVLAFDGLHLDTFAERDARKSAVSGPAPDDPGRA